MRLFVAVEIDESVRRAAARLIGDLEQRLEGAGAGGTVRWVAPANLHLTLKFIGEVDETVGARVCEALETPFRLAPFDLHLAGAGVFPLAGPPRVVWARVINGGAEAVRLHRVVEARLRAVGIPADDRVHHPHLTLGRVRGAARRQQAALRGTVSAIRADLGRCRVEGITLFESRLQRAGPAYRPLARARLEEKGDEPGSAPDSGM